MACTQRTPEEGPKSATPRNTWQRRATWASAQLVLLGLVALFAAAPIFSVDFFWLLKLGELIATRHEIPRTDVFSAVHPERAYVQFQWLWELIAYGAYRAADLKGVRVMQVVVLVLTYLCAIRVCIRAFRNRSLAFAWCALALLWFEDRFQARPSSMVLGLLVLALPWLIDERLTASRRECALIALLACVWSNLHGGEALLLPLCLGARAVGFSLSTRGARAAWWQVGASVLGVVLSPIFVPGLLTWADAIGPQIQTGNREWLPSYSMLHYGWSPSHVLIAFGPTLVLVAYAVEQWRACQRSRAAGSFDAPWAEWLLVAGVLVLAHHAVRNVFLALVPLAFMGRRLSARCGRKTEVLAGAMGTFFLVAAAHNHIVEGYGGVTDVMEAITYDLAPNSFPEELADFMEEAQIEGGVLNDGRWGGYLIWRVWPRCTIFVDSRHDLSREMWPVFLASMALDRRPSAMDFAFRRWGIELAVFRGPTFPAIRESGDWQLLYKTGDQELYQHRQGHHATSNTERAQRWLTAHADPVLLPTDSREVGLATRVGAARWLRAPYQRFRLTKARSLSASLETARKIEGITIEADLFYDAGLFSHALSLLHEVLSLDPNHVGARYRAALASFALGQNDESRRHFIQLRPHSDALSKHQLERLVVLSQALAR